MTTSSAGLERVFAEIDRRAEEYIAGLEEMVRVPSISARGERLDEMAEMVAARMRAVGLKADLVRVEGAPPAIVAVGGPTSGTTLLFYNHYDVQPPEPLDQWKSNPFEPWRRDGRLYGRGINDNKGNLANRLAAIQAWMAAEGRLPCRVKFFVEGEEETGSPHLAPLLEAARTRLSADAMLWEGGGVDQEGRPLINAGMKGMLYVDLIARGPKSDIHSKDSVRVPNPAWRLVWALASLKAPDEACLIPGFYDDVRAPTEAERAAAAAIPSDEEAFRKAIGIDSFVLGLSGQELKEWTLFQPTCNIAGLISGYTGQGSKTVLPAEARAKVDFRMVPDQDPDAILAALRRHFDDSGFTDIEIHPRGPGEPGYRTPIEHPFVQLVAGAAREVYPLPPALVPTSTGSGPLALIAGTLGIPSATAGSANPESRSHGPNENITIRDFLRATRHIAAILHAMGKAEPASWPAVGRQ